jgi:hypothetical protein
MTYNKLTGDCVCKCNFAWKSRTKNPPVKCPSCGSRVWQSNTRAFTSILCRAGIQDEKTGTRQFCIIDYVDSPAIVSDDIFYVSKEDLNKYFAGRSPPGSGIIMLGSFEIGSDLLLKIDNMKLVYCHEAAYLTYISTISCLYNVKSFYLKQAALKKYNGDLLLKEQAEDRRKEETIQAGKARLEAVKKRQIQTEEMERKLADDSASMEERLQAVAFLGK